MKFSEFYIPTLKEEPSEADIPSHSLALRAGLIRKVASGVYSLLPAGLKVLRKIEDIVREEMNNAGAVELFLPVIQPSDLWKKTGRWEEYGPDMFRLKDRNKRDFCLGPTHEELITYMAHMDIKSYKDLPVNLYQIQVKFRDEIRPRYGLLRAREFIMKDSYSFCRNEEDSKAVYDRMYDAYCRIIERIGLEYKVVEAKTGVIGGKFSHEFIVLAENGEEKIVFCPGCSYCANCEMSEFIPAPGKKKKEDVPSEGDRCIKCKGELKFEKGIEVGHIFMLGRKYSDKLGAKFLDMDGKLKSLVMGCYGIGISRMLSAAIEQLHDDKGIIWPLSIAPFTVNLISTTTKNKDLSTACEKVYKTLKKLDVEVLYDDRDVSAGIKFKDSDLIGIPIRFIVGQKFLNNKIIDVEYRTGGSTEEISADQIPEFIKKIKTSSK